MIAFISIVAAIAFLFWFRRRPQINPFAKDDTLPCGKLVTNQKERDAVLKQAFSPKKVPDKVDAIVIGSGIGGLTVAATLAKSGWRVLVLEQHDQAGGCCHTFLEKGYEFDVGIHYIGNLAANTPARTVVDQLTRGQLRWAPLDDEYDVAVLGGKQYNFLTGQQRWIENIKKNFPDNAHDVDKFVESVRTASSCTIGWILLKFLPFRVSQFLIRTGLINIITRFYKMNQRTVLETVQSITDNKELQAVFMYCFGDYGTVPDKAGFPIHALLVSHFWDGAYYPIGGASEIAFHIIPVIERSGGRVLTNASVSRILLDQHDRRVKGVRVQKCIGGHHDILSSVVVSTAGVYNTLKKLLPFQVASQSRLWPLTSLPSAAAGFTAFVGLDARPEQILGTGGCRVAARNWWSFDSNNVVDISNRYLAGTLDEAIETGPPILFISFPSVKDPEWSARHDSNRSVMTLVTLCRNEWFSAWADKPVQRRGADYDSLKTQLAQRLLDRALDLFPQLTQHVEYMSVGSSLSHSHYLAASHGQMYGMDHCRERFEASSQNLLRAETDIYGLYLSGQDIVSCGFFGALNSGLLTSCSLLGRNVFSDIDILSKKIYKTKHGVK